MTSNLSLNTQAALLLTAPLMAGQDEPAPDTLTAGGYKKLVRLLRDNQHEPGALVGPNAEDALVVVQHIFEGDRIKSLLDRGFLLSQAVERWHARAIWIAGTSDDTYPSRIKSLLGDDAPPILYGCGETSLLESGGLAVVGSRNVDEALVAYTEEIGRLTAASHRTLVSGGARGIDRAAMRGALDAGGCVAGVLADSLERVVLKREHRDFLMDGRLTVISPYDPTAGFNVGHAMQRNKLIYALADAALVVSSDFEKGGTWNGAVEQLEKLRFAPLYVRTSGDINKGLEALRRKGALPWPNPASKESLDEVLESARDSLPVPSQQGELFPPFAQEG